MLKVFPLHFSLLHTKVLIIFSLSFYISKIYMFKEIYLLPYLMNKFLSNYTYYICKLFKEVCYDLKNLFHYLSLLYYASAL